MTRTVYYFNCQILNESFLYNLLRTIVFLLLNRTLREYSWFVFTMCVVGHLIKVCVEFYCVARFLSMTWNPSTLQFHNKKKKKQTNNTNTEIWQHVDDTTNPEPVAKNQGNMIQDTVNE